MKIYIFVCQTCFSKFVFLEFFKNVIKPRSKISINNISCLQIFEGFFEIFVRHEQRPNISISIIHFVGILWVTNYFWINGVAMKSNRKSRSYIEVKFYEWNIKAVKGTLLWEVNESPRERREGKIEGEI